LIYIEVKQEYNDEDYENSQGIKVLQDLGINIDDSTMDNVFNTLLDLNLDMEIDGNIPTDINLDSNIDKIGSNKEIDDRNQKALPNKNYNNNNEASSSTTASASTSTTISATTLSNSTTTELSNKTNDSHNKSSEFKMPESKIKIKQEIPSNNILVSSSIPPLHEVKTEANKEVKYEINQNQKRMNDSNYSDDDNEICPPSPEEDVATSIFSSQFDKQLSKKVRNFSIIIL